MAAGFRRSSGWREGELGPSWSRSEPAVPTLGHCGVQTMRPPPRLFGILARDAPVVAVLRRGPSSWAHIGRWDVAAATYLGGSWLRGTLYPQRCDVSPDGRFLAAMALVPRAEWAPGAT
jgi:hypothetical protein